MARSAEIARKLKGYEAAAILRDVDGVFDVVYCSRSCRAQFLGAAPLASTPAAKTCDCCDRPRTTKPDAVCSTLCDAHDADYSVAMAGGA